MNATQKYAVYNQQNVTSVLTNAMRQKHLVTSIINVRSAIDKRPPKKCPHLSNFANPYDRSR